MPEIYNTNQNNKENNKAKEEINATLHMLGKLRSEKEQEKKVKVKEVSDNLKDFILNSPEKATDLFLKNKTNISTAENEMVIMKKGLNNQQRQIYIEFLEKQVFSSKYNWAEKQFLLQLRQGLVIINQEFSKNKNSPDILANYRNRVDIKDMYITQTTIAPRETAKGEEQPISNKDMNTLFPDLKLSGLMNELVGKESYIDGQGHLGDCYLITAINTRRNNPYFFQIMKNSLHKTKTGFIIGIPFGETGGKKINVTRNELKYAAATGLGYKIIEIAYSKYARNDNMIESFSEMRKIEGGNPQSTLETLLGKEKLQSIIIDPLLTPEYKQAYMNFLSVNRKIQQKVDISIEEKQQALVGLDKYGSLIERKKDIQKILTAAKVPTDMLTAGSLLGFQDSNEIKIDNERVIYRKHAYAIQDIIKNKDTQQAEKIILLNPWNKGKNGANKIVLNIDEFCQYFSKLGFSRTKQNFGNNISTTINKTISNNNKAKHPQSSQDLT